MSKRMAKVTVLCSAYYESEVEIPDEVENVKEYIQDNIEELSIDELNYIGNDVVESIDVYEEEE